MSIRTASLSVNCGTKLVSQFSSTFSSALGNASVSTLLLKLC